MITFYLKRNVKWQDGVPFTAKDVLFTYKIITNPKTASLLKDNFDFIEDVTVVDKWTITFTFKYKMYKPEWKFTALKIIPAHKFLTIQPMPDEEKLDTKRLYTITEKHLYMYSQPDVKSRKVYKLPYHCRIVVKKIKNDWIFGIVRARGKIGKRGWIPLYKTYLSRNDKFRINPVGTGYYIFKTVNYSGDIILEKNKNYYIDPPYIDFVIRHHTTDKQTLINNINVGNIDLIPETPIDQISALFPKKVKKIEYSSLSFSGFLLNCKNQFLKNSEVRRAMTLGFNRAQQLKVFYGNRGKLLAGPFSYDSWGINLDLKPLPYDPKKAKELLKKYSPPTEPLVLIVKTDENSVVFDICLSFIDSMAKLKIPVRMVKLERLIWQDRLEKGDFDIAYIEWAFDLGYNIYGLFHSKGKLNYGNYSNPDVDDLLDKMKIEIDPAMIIEEANLIQEQLYQDCPYIFLWTLDNVAAASHRLKGIDSDTISPFGFFDFINKWWIPKEFQ